MAGKIDEFLRILPNICKWHLNTKVDKFLSQLGRNGNYDPEVLFCNAFQREIF